MHNVLIQPIFSEKSVKDAENSKFTFLVDLSSSKDDVKKAIEAAYNVHVLDIATIIVKGKGKRVGKKRTEKLLGKKKKAIIRIQKGQKIDAFETGEKKGK